MRGACFAILVALAASFAVAQPSPPQQPSGSPPAQDVRPPSAASPPSDPQSNTKGEPTKRAPVVIEGEIAARRSEHRTAWEAKEAQEKSDNDSQTIWVAQVSVAVAALLLLVALIQAGMFYWQLRLMRWGTVVAQRAYVSARDPFPVEPVKNDANNIVAWDLTIVWENTGSTPASQFRAAAGVMDIQSGAEPEKIGGFVQTSLQHYSDVGSSHTVRSKCRVSPSQLTRLHANQASLFVVGRAEYFDVFPGSKQHHTLVCTRIVITDPTLKAARPFELNVYGAKGHNEST